MLDTIKQLLKEKHKVLSDEYIELYRDSDFVFIIPLTHNASRKYGSGTQWCTTNRDCDVDFKKHTKLGVLGYIVIRNDQLKKQFGSNAYGIYSLYGDNSNRFIAFDDQNNEYRNGGEWLSNEFDKQDKLSQYYKMLRIFNDYYNKKNKDVLTESLSVKRKKLALSFLDNLNLNHWENNSYSTEYLTTKKGVIIVMVTGKFDILLQDTIFDPLLRILNGDRDELNNLIWEFVISKGLALNAFSLVRRSGNIGEIDIRDGDILVEKKPKNNIRESNVDNIEKILYKYWDKQKSLGKIPMIDNIKFEIMGVAKYLKNIGELYFEYVGGEDNALENFDAYLENLTVTSNQVRGVLQNEVQPGDNYSVLIHGIQQITDYTETYKALDFAFGINYANLNINNVIVDIDDLSEDAYFDAENNLRQQIESYVLYLATCFGLKFNDATSVWND